MKSEMDKHLLYLKARTKGIRKPSETLNFDFWK